MRQFTALFAFFLACTVAGCATIDPAAAPAGVYRFKTPIKTVLIGNWQGTLISHRLATELSKDDPGPGEVGLRLAIGSKDTVYRVAIKGRPVEEKVAMMTERVFSNATVTDVAVHPATEESGKSFAVTTILVTAKTDDTAIVEWAEVRIFLNESGDHPPAVGRSAVGILHRLR